MKISGNVFVMLESHAFVYVSVNYSTAVEALIKNPPHECILEVARLLDKPDEMGDDWRRLWSVLINRPLNESMVRARREGPTCFVLSRWCQMKPTSQATVERLIEALNDIFRNDVARCLEEYCQVRTMLLYCKHWM